MLQRIFVHLQFDDLLLQRRDLETQLLVQDPELNVFLCDVLVLVLALSVLDLPPLNLLLLGLNELSIGLLQPLHGHGQLFQGHRLN